MDELARYNRERWEELAGADVRYSRPILDLTPESARTLVDPEGVLGSVEDQDTLCLAGGGGQESAALGLLGARVTVLDLSPTQLARDRETAARYGLEVATAEGDMRDLSRFPDESFDVVWHAYSINFVPDARRALEEASRVLRRGGRYRLAFNNPFVHGTWDRWGGTGFLIEEPYIDSAQVHYEETRWDVESGDGAIRRVEGPREFRHTLTTVFNTLVGGGLVILGVWEGTWDSGDPSRPVTPGSWEHFTTVAPPLLTLWARKQPEVFSSGW